MPAERRGLAMSTYQLGFDSGIAAGSIGLGTISQVFGFETLWTVAGVCVLLSLLGLMRSLRAGRRYAAV